MKNPSRLWFPIPKRCARKMPSRKSIPGSAISSSNRHSLCYLIAKHSQLDRAAAMRRRTYMNTFLGILLIFALFAVAALLVGCAPNRCYRTDYNLYDKPNANEDPLNKAVVETRPEYKLGFVEFDEEGWFWNPDQAKTVEDLV